MKTTKYFDSMRNWPDRAIIQDEWIKHVMDNFEKKQLQSDGHMRKWAKIKQMEGRYLRVVLLEDGVTVHNAFFDRGFKL